MENNPGNLMNISATQAANKLDIPPRKTAEMDANFDGTEVIPDNNTTVTDNLQQLMVPSNVSFAESMATLDAQSVQTDNTSQEGLQVQAIPSNSHPSLDIKQPKDKTDSNHTPAPSGTPTSAPDKSTVQPRSDTGWAWVVLVSAFAVNAAALGSASSLSVYLNVWMDYFGANAATIGFVVSTHSLMRGIFSPASGALCKKFGPRAAMMVGGVIFVGGNIMAAASPSVGVLILSNGLVSAFGSSLTRASSFQTLTSYFKKRFTFAIGMSSAGTSIGQLAFPPLYTYLIDLYGWRGSMLIIAGVSLHIVAAGALMRPIGPTSRKMMTKRGPKEKTVSNNNTTNATKHANRVNGNITHQENKGVDSRLTNSILTKDESRLNNSPEEKADDLTVRESANSDAKTSSVFGVVKHHLSDFKHFMLETYGIRRLSRNVEFITLLFVAVCHGFGKLGLVFTVARAESVGLELRLASLLLSLIGVGSTIGRITHGWFIDKKYITAEMVYILAMLFFGGLVALIPTLVNFIPLAIISFPMGMVTGIAGTLLTVVVRQHVQTTDTAGAFGTQLFFWGIGDIIGVFVTGLIYDNLHSYDVAFFIGGGVSVTASTLTFAIYMNQKRRQSYKQMASPQEDLIQPAEASSNRFDPEHSGSVQPNDAECGLSNPSYVPTSDVLSVDVVLVRGCDVEKNVPRKDSLCVTFAGKSETPQTEGVWFPFDVNSSSVC